MVTDSGDWCWDSLNSLLPSSILLHLADIKPPLPCFPSDVLAWMGELDGCFSIRSAYNSCTNDTPASRDKVWRYRSYGSEVSAGTTDVDTAGITSAMQDFCWMNIKDWVHWNLTRPEFITASHEDWDLLFGVVVWNIWLTRNVVAFNHCCKLGGSILARSFRLVTLAKALVINPSSSRRRSWVVRLNHILRNLNKMANSLAKLPTSNCLDLIVFDTPPISVCHLLDSEVVP
ncbi:hypothetical protein V6N13_125268 [Hibiscus sabdariffa]